jgi:NAD(P)-dependent dehydrogenase (short-subunit alcohol dehydrogenase family)
MIEPGANLAPPGLMDFGNLVYRGRTEKEHHRGTPVALVTGAGRASGIGAAIAHRLAATASTSSSPTSAPRPASWPTAATPARKSWRPSPLPWPRTAGRPCPARRRRRRRERAGHDRCHPRGVRPARRARQQCRRRHRPRSRSSPCRRPPGAAPWRSTPPAPFSSASMPCRCLWRRPRNEPPGARIVNIASIAAVRPKPMTAAYAASKAAVVALTQSLAQEVAAAGITVNAVLPGDVDTGMKQWQLQLEAAFRRHDVAEATAATIPHPPRPARHPRRRRRPRRLPRQPRRRLHHRAGVQCDRWARADVDTRL